MKKLKKEQLEQLRLQALGIEERKLEHIKQFMDNHEWEDNKVNRTVLLELGGSMANIEKTILKLKISGDSNEPK